jgi:fructose-1,6-bisphosphatase I
MILSAFLLSSLANGYADDDQVNIITGLALAAVDIDHLVRRNGLNHDDLGRDIGGINADGDSQKALDVKAEELIIKHLQGGRAAALLSEEQDDLLPLSDAGEIIVAVDPLDGSSNIDVNVTIGTIFSLLPSHGDAAANMLQAGRQQLAAGFFTYGPQTTLILTFARGGGVSIFTLDPDLQVFVETNDAAVIPTDTKEFAINSAYANHWMEPMQAWMADTLAGKGGPCGKDYRMRWVGSLVSDALRIFQRGGVFLYPANQRKGYSSGRLRLIYEANPIALLVEAAGGMASNGYGDILDLVPQNLHQRVPLFFGAKDEVERLEKEHQNQA